MSVLGRITQGVHDWSLVKKIKKDLLAAVRATPPGRLVRIDTAYDPTLKGKLHLFERATIELVKDHPNEIEVLDQGTGIGLMRKINAFSMFNEKAEQRHAEFEEKFDILTAKNLAAIGQFDKARLPEREYRYGLPADFNGTPERVEQLLSESVSEREQRLIDEGQMEDQRRRAPIVGPDGKPVPFTFEK